jgi:hypothetical protein
LVLNPLPRETRMNKIAAYNILLESHPLWTKEARVFGESRPDVSEALEPVKYRTEKVKRYADIKSSEQRTPLGTAMAVGGITGAALGGLVGLSGGVPGTLAGGVIGGGLGALTGAALSESDAAEIERMKKIKKTKSYEKASVEMGLEQVRRRREDEYWEREARHQRQMAAIDRLDRKIDRQTYGRHYGSPYRY